MMATHGAVPTSKVSYPEPGTVQWRVFPKTAIFHLGVRVEAQSWDVACERGAPLLGLLKEAVDAEKAVQA